MFFPYPLLKEEGVGGGGSGFQPVECQIIQGEVTLIRVQKNLPIALFKLTTSFMKHIANRFNDSI